jgi:hypothetical protein
MDPQPRKKRQAQDKKKSKGQIYSGKHVRLSLQTNSHQQNEAVLVKNKS